MEAVMPTEFDFGFLVGLLVGEGYFGGDGRQPQVALRMHVRHEAIFQWLERTFPGGRLYGPYNHDGRHYFQWMARGPYLRDELVPVLDRLLSPSLDRHSFGRYQRMKSRYPQLAAKPGESAVPSTIRHEAAPRPLTRRNAARRSTTSAIRTSDRPASAPSAFTARADDHHGTGPQSASPAKPAQGADTFADLFKEIREAWPS
jgi:hypothetical protein